MLASGIALYSGVLFSQWQGDILIGTLVNKEVRRVRLSNDGSEADDVEGLFGELDERIRDVRVGPEGEIYLLTDSPVGRLLRVVPAK
ncbi:PQQ-dependent sugar dehydrogenase [Vreelandella titanicae]|uniref:PQQ-dependent sugar dehydrogenase n=1 Tax=Vreelandella titanicae TaxID=664683 RepID=UPI0021BD1278|nr:PQQ-dependent sugar dehydrogenase [Halomonas titanicae]